MKKFAVIFVALCAACALVLSCASTGGGNSGSILTGTGTPAVGSWGTYDDHEVPNNGSSTAELVELEEMIDGQMTTVYKVTGNLTTQFVYGFAGWYIDPDEDTFNRLKTAKGFSFKILGDGQRYTIKYKTTDCQVDYCYYEYSFDTVAGEAVTIEVPMKYLMQPSWGIWKTLNQNNVIGVEWQTHEVWRKNTTTNPFEIKIWDFRVYN